MRDLVFQAGMPRSGSTVMSAVLDQNPQVHAAQHSPVCQIMWDLHVSCQVNAAEQLHASGRGDFQADLIGSIPGRFWTDATGVVVDKCMTWTLPDNLALIRRYITDRPKILILDRPDDDVIESFRGVYNRACMEFDEDRWRLPGSQPVARSREAVEWARSCPEDGTFHFVNFDDWMTDPPGIIAGIYKFFNWKPFAHDFQRIVTNHPEDDQVHGVPGLHDVRRTVSLRPPLAAADWTQLGDAALGDHTATEWATYRQALRDLPSAYDRVSEVVWPETPPEEAARLVAEAEAEAARVAAL